MKQYVPIDLLSTMESRYMIIDLTKVLSIDLFKEKILLYYNLSTLR